MVYYNHNVYRRKSRTKYVKLNMGPLFDGKKMKKEINFSFGLQACQNYTCNYRNIFRGSLRTCQEKEQLVSESGEESNNSQYNFNTILEGKQWGLMLPLKY